MEKSLPPIPVKRYFTIGEVAELCDVKPHVLRYWEQEFSQLRPMKRRGNRRYYQHHEVLMIRRIRELLYDQGFTISGARNKMQELLQADRLRLRQDAELKDSPELACDSVDQHGIVELDADASEWVRRELLAIRQVLLHSSPNHTIN
jgi:DNA-binding transcriptional MerR regulator